MTKKRVTVIVYGADRNVWASGPLDVRVTDIFARGGPRDLYAGVSRNSTIDLQMSLPFDAGQVYGLTFSSPGHRPAWQLIRRADFVRMPDNIEIDAIILRLMIVPDTPGFDDLPNGFDRLVAASSPFAGAGVDADAYRGLKTAAQMAMLNVEAKLRESYIDGVPLLSYVKAIQHAAEDRVFLKVDVALKAKIERSGDFAGAAGHKAPAKPPGLSAHPDSWKHRRFSEGNVQLSFSEHTMPLSADDDTPVHSVDADIDLGRGLAHVVEWLENNVFRPGHKTNQALVYGLLYAQNILPHYILNPLPATTARTLTLMPVRRARLRGRTAPRAANRPPATRRKSARPIRRRRKG